MLDERMLLLFVPAMIAFTLAPGPDTLFVVGSALRDGGRGGVLAAFGILLGGSVHITLAAVGLSVLILKSALAFAIIKYAGGAYLVYLGVRTLLQRGVASPTSVVIAEPRSWKAIIARGFLTNALNPKVAMFVIAFFPQFVSPARGPVWSQMVELGVLWYVVSLFWLSFVGLTVGRLGQSATRTKQLQTVLKYAAGSIFIGLGLRVAIPDR
ncbi:MAG TPA: LysE family translocator [Candidatus Acidoferrales bacterium]|nr:LysE family translocator [Candidatus Acidoferrales bacterium]